RDRDPRAELADRLGHEAARSTERRRQHAGARRVAARLEGRDALDEREGSPGCDRVAPQLSRSPAAGARPTILQKVSTGKRRGTSASLSPARKRSAGTSLSTSRSLARPAGVSIPSRSNSDSESPPRASLRILP